MEELKEKKEILTILEKNLKKYRKNPKAEKEKEKVLAILNAAVERCDTAFLEITSEKIQCVLGDFSFKTLLGRKGEDDRMVFLGHLNPENYEYMSSQTLFDRENNIRVDYLFDPKGNYLSKETRAIHEHYSKEEIEESFLEFMQEL